MAKWEYCRLAWMTQQVSSEDAEDLRNNFLVKIIENPDVGAFVRRGTLKYIGSTKKAEVITEIDDTIAQLGLEGWELVSHMESTDHVKFQVLYFKRPLQ